jgi:decaprenyl-phosphate phosphoribosyltransferase
MHDLPNQPAETRPLWLSLIKLVRPQQWSKSVFVLVGPAYSIRDMPEGTDLKMLILWALVAAASFSLASSGCYVLNDLADAEADRQHPRKCRRPIADGAVTSGVARVYALCLYLVAAALALLLPEAGRWWFVLTLGLYVLNVNIYTGFFKHLVIADVMGLSIGFVLRVLGGCAALSVEPSTWLLNVTLFVSMFLAFGKRLGERRMFARTADGAEVGGAVHHRRVQEGYTDTTLEMAVVVTAVTTLVTYAFYVQDQEGLYHTGFNLLWLTVLPATYAMLRAIVLLERGEYDDPTELAVHDRACQGAGIVFVMMTAVLMIYWHQPPNG